MYIYLITFIFSCLSLFVFEKFNGKVKYIFLFIGIFLPAFLAGCRADIIGTDVRNYVEPIQIYASGMSRFTEYINGNIVLLSGDAFSRIEKGYSTFVFLISRINKSLFLNLFITQFLIIGLTVIGLVKFKKYINISLSFSMFLYYMLFFNISLNLVRQSIAMAIIFCAFPFLLENKWLQFLISIFIATLFHRTAIIGLIVFILYLVLIRDVQIRKIKFGEKTLCIKWKQLISGFIVLLAAIILIGSSSILNPILHLLNLSNFGLLYSKGFGSFSLSQTLIRLPFLFLLIFSWKKMENDNLKYFYFVLTVIDILFSQMSGGSSIILRISYYLSIFYIYAIPNEIEVWSSRRRIMLQGIFIIGCLSYWYYMFVLNNYNETVPFIFNPMLF